MMRKSLIALFAAALASIASAATLSPIQLLNPTGSTAGQAIVSSGPSSAPAWSSLATGSLAPVAANTVIGNFTGSSAAPAANAIASCSAAGNALLWTSGTGLTCGTGYALLASPTFTGTPAAPTAAAGTNTTQIATTAFTNTIFAAPPALGSTTPAAVSATTLSASSTVSGAGFSTYLASPPAIGTTAPAAGKFTTLQATGAITPSSTAGIVGTATNDNANAGSWGEYQSASPAGISLSNGVAANVASVPLTAGDWDVSGNINFGTGTGDTLTAGFAGISTVSATQPASPLYSGFTGISVAPSNFYTSATMTTRISIAGSATVYLVGTGYHSGGTLTATGIIRARRVR